jgi:transmembrane sensor
MDKHQLDELIVKFLTKVPLTDAESEAVRQWFDKHESRQEWLSRVRQEEWAIDNLRDFYNDDAQKINWEKLQGLLGLERETPVRKIGFRWPRIAAAAAILILLSAIAYFWNKREHAKPGPSAPAIASVISPGRNRATLILSGNRQIDLDNTKTGIIASQAGAEVQKIDGGRLSYIINDEMSVSEEYNTLVTPRGGQYFVELSDGSRVWLNASSSLRYPTNMSGKDRRVALTGEGYFEIATLYRKSSASTHEKIPFVVSANGVEVEVKGTHFNVNSYADETSIKATLLEGSIRIVAGNESSSVKPGQQAKVSLDSRREGKIAISNADTEDAVSWKNGITSFKNEDIRGIMRQVARWYDVTVSYQGGQIPTKTFIGGIPRDTNISDLLKALEMMSGMHFSTVGKQIIVTP